LKKLRFFISACVLFLFTCSLRAQVPPFIAAEPFDSIAKADSFNAVQRFELLSYEEKLNQVMTVHTSWVELIYYNVDTSAKKLSLSTQFELPRCLASAMIHDFRSDDSLAPVAKPCIQGSSRYMFQFGKMTLKWNSRIKGFLSEGPLPLLAIGKQPINKQVKGYVMVEQKKSGNVLSIYLENGKGGWYTFCYSNGIMLIYTPDEKLKSKIANQPVRRGKSPDPRYRSTLGSPNERNLILKKVKRAEYDPNEKKEFAPQPVHTRADTLRIDSIAEEIRKLSVPGLFTSQISKTFACEDSGGEGTVTVLSGKDLTKIVFSDCGSDHGASGFEAVFYYDKLVYFYEESGSWSFDPAHATDSTSSTFDETITSSEYFENGLVIKNIRGYIILYSYNGERKSVDNTTYYFDKSGGSDAEQEKRIRQWIDFAHSEKSYAEFFESASK
jgi:hypothetical protein